MADFIRLRCPVCGSMPYPKQLENWETKKHVTDVILMSILGKTPAEPDEEYKKKGKGKGGHGNIIYKVVSQEELEEYEKWKAWFAKSTVQFAQDSGFIEGEK